MFIKSENNVELEIDRFLLSRKKVSTKLNTINLFRICFSSINTDSFIHFFKKKSPSPASEREDSDSEREAEDDCISEPESDSESVAAVEVEKGKYTKKKKTKVKKMYIQKYRPDWRKKN